MSYVVFYNKPNSDEYYVTIVDGNEIHKQREWLSASTHTAVDYSITIAVCPENQYEVLTRLHIDGIATDRWVTISDSALHIEKQKISGKYTDTYNNDIVTAHELCKYMSWVSGKDIRHSVLLENIRKHVSSTSFGSVESTLINVNGNTIKTYILSPEQCIALAAQRSMVLQLTIIHRLRYLECKYDNFDVLNGIRRELIIGGSNTYSLLLKLRECDVTLRHDTLKRRVDKWSTIPMFGETLGELLVRTPRRSIVAYKLTPLQIVAVAATINMEIQLRIIRRLHELEKKYIPTVKTTQAALMEALKIYRAYVDEDISPDVPVIEEIDTNGHKFHYCREAYIFNPLTDNPRIIPNYKI